MTIRVNNDGFLELVNNASPPQNNPRLNDGYRDLLNNLFSSQIVIEDPYFKEITRSTKDDKSETFLALEI